LSYPLRARVMLAILALGTGATGAAAETALVAVAANFAEAAQTLAPMFMAATGHDVRLTTGSTGKLYAQIGEGAPFEVLLSADASTPAKLEAEGKAVAGSRFTYAVGQVALYSANPQTVGADGKAALENPALRFIAIANPDLAPYGVAAREAMQAMALWDALLPKVVMGQNIGQTFSLVATGAAEMGFVALSAVKAPRQGDNGQLLAGAAGDVHADPAGCRAVAGGRHNPAAVAFVDF
jgi:molybdate transport system substrate-binding protein